MFCAPPEADFTTRMGYYPGKKRVWPGAFQMRAFLSHSSKDKGFVESVAELLRPKTFELELVTFDGGLLNSTVIAEALKRSDLFCLRRRTSSGSGCDLKPLGGQTSSADLDHIAENGASEGAENIKGRRLLRCEVAHARRSREACSASSLTRCSGGRI